MTATSSVTDRERGAWICFNRAAGVGTRRVRLLLDRFGSLDAAWQAPRAELRLAGLDKRALDGVDLARKQFTPERELERVARARARVVIWPDADFPRLLANIPDPPPLLYVRGSFAEADDWALAVVGTRRPTIYGRDVAQQLTAELAAAGVTIVSGLAKGIDTHAHRGALAGGGRTIAVLGNGIDRCYPPENDRLAQEIAERGALITEYAIGVGPLSENFPPRNRIISGLSAGVLVVEAGDGSGALITSAYAAEQGRDVFAVPGPINSFASKGCHRLIQDGARLVGCADDVLAELNPHLAAVSPQQLALDFGAPSPGANAAPAGAGPSAVSTNPDGALLALLASEGQPIHIDQLARASGRPVHEISGLLTLLEVQGRVRHLGGMRYTVAR